MEYCDEILLFPVLRLGLCSGRKNQKQSRKSNTEDAYEDTMFLHN